MNCSNSYQMVRKVSLQSETVFDAQGCNINILASKSASCTSTHCHHNTPKVVLILSMHRAILWWMVVTFSSF